MEKTFQVVLCPDCFGDRIETCHNPDHGFLSGVVGAVYRGNESACPGCGHSSDHKMKGKCYTCKGSGKVSKEDYDKYLDEFVDENDKDVIDEHCLKNPLFNIDREDLYEYDKPKERTRKRLMEIAECGMEEVMTAEFGYKGVMSGLYIEKVWRDSDEDFKSYMDWAKGLITASLNVK